MAAKESMLAKSTLNELVELPTKTLPGYYRTKLFVSNIGMNALVTAAHPLLSLIECLKTNKELPSWDLLFENISHELRAFQSKAQGYHCNDESILIAQYLLTATLDETLAKCLKRLGKSPEFKAFTPISADNVGPEQRFFDILEKTIETPNSHLDLLELIYLCLNSGFEGKYHGQMDGRQSLDDKIDEVYQIITKFRATKPINFFKRPLTPPVQKASSTKKNTWLLVIIACSVLTGGYLISHTIIEKKARAILSQHYHNLDNE